MAFDKDNAFEDRPRADELEEMVGTFPGLRDINWDAKTVKSGINFELWNDGSGSTYYNRL